VGSRGARLRGDLERLRVGRERASLVLANAAARAAARARAGAGAARAGRTAERRARATHERVGDDAGEHDVYGEEQEEEEGGEGGPPARGTRRVQLVRDEGRGVST
jgi:hypothetical protein